MTFSVQSCNRSSLGDSATVLLVASDFGRMYMPGSRTQISTKRNSTSMKALALITSITGTLVCSALAQAPAETPEKAAIVANDRAFEAAYAKADVKAIADFFTEDAEYTSDDGRTFK